MIRRYLLYLQQSLRDWNEIFLSELRTIFSDAGVLIFFILVPLGYPLLYTFIYNKETIREVPVAVVDNSRTKISREYLRRLDATADVQIVSHCADMAEARDLVREREAYGVVEIPADFSKALNRG